MGDRKVLSKGLQDTNPDKWQIWYQCVCSASLLTIPEQKAQGHEENIYSFIPRISKEHQLGAMCRESRSCFPGVVPSSVGKREPTRSFPFFIMIIQSKHFLTFGRPLFNLFSSASVFFFPRNRKWEFCLGNYAYATSGQKRSSWQWFITAFSLQRLFSHKQYSIHRTVCFISSFLCLVGYSIIR